MHEVIDTISSFFSTLLIIPLLGTGIYLTWRLKLVQMIRFGHSWKVVAGVYDKDDDEGDVNHLQALSAALSATIGIGNIAGVATAIHFGGPGALFWMWVTAFLGMATKFSEATLAMKYRKIHKDGSASGGPMYYIEQGLGKSWKPLAVVFAGATIISSFGTGNAIQAFTVADSFRADFGVPVWLTGLILAIAVGLVIIGGIRRIGVVTSRLVPFMALLYVLSALFVVGKNIAEVPATFAMIFENAFTPRGATGGFAGSTFFMAVLWGVRRGIYSNESGQGSAPIAHAAAKTEEPVREGTVAMIGPFLDTLLICTLTGLTILTSGAWKTPYPTDIAWDSASVVHAHAELLPGGRVQEESHFTGEAKIVNGQIEDVRYVFQNGFVETPNWVYLTEDGDTIPIDGAVLIVEDGTPTGLTGREGNHLEDAILRGKALRNGSLLTSQAFEQGLGGKWGSWMVTFGVLLFAISTAISWSYYGDRASVYLFGRRGIRPYRLVYVVVVFLASNLALTTVWGFGDVALSIMAIPNLIALILLAPKIKEMKEEYFSRDHVPVRKQHW